MKKTIALLISVVMTCSVLASCGGKSDSSSGKTSSGTSSGSSSAVDEGPKFEADNTPIETKETPLPDLTEVKNEYDTNKADIDVMLEKISKEKERPCINITTQSGEKIKTKDHYVASVIDVFNCDDSFRLTAEGGVKVRGNSTADQGDEKPYRIKFQDKHNMLGLHSGEEYRSWVLLRSFWNLAPDYTAFNLAKEIFNGEYYSTDFMYVNVFVNGDPKGIYVLCEQNQAVKGRAEVNEPKEGDTEVETGYFIEMDNYPDDDHPFFTLDYEQAEIEDIAGETRQFTSAEYSLHSDIYTQGQLDFIEQYTKGIYKILYEAAVNDKAMKFDSAYNVVDADGISAQEAVENVIDLKSLANMLILEELVHNYDVGEGSFYMAIDLGEDSNYPKFTFFAPWDFNWAYEGNPSGGYYAATFQPEVGSQDRSNPWFITAMKADWFVQIVKDRWQELSDKDAIKTACKKVLDDAELLKNDLGEEEWKIDKAYDIVGFVYGRADFLDGEWK